MINASTVASTSRSYKASSSTANSAAARKPKAVSAVKTVKAAKEKPDFSRNHLEWLEKEDDKLLEMSFGMDVVTIYDLSKKFNRDPVQILSRLLESEIPEMAGIEMDHGSDEACEFFGLALSGIPIDLALRWCAATLEQENRPTWAEVRSAMLSRDARPAMYLVRDHGLWFSGVFQLDAVFELLVKPAKDIAAAVKVLIDRIDSLSAKTVLSQMVGELRMERPVNWSVMKSCLESTGSSGKKTVWAKKRRSSSTGSARRSSGRKSYARKRS